MLLMVLIVFLDLHEIFFFVFNLVNSDAIFFNFQEKFPGVEFTCISFI